MAKIIFTGWRPGFKKVEFSRYLWTNFNLPLRDAFETTNALLEYKTVTLPVSDGSSAEELVSAARSLGAIAYLG